MNRTSKAFTGIAGPILMLTAWAMLAGAALAQTPNTGGYMRMVSASGHAIAGESTDPVYKDWIPLRTTTTPSPAELAAMARQNAASSGANAINPPIVVVKDRDRSSLALLAAYSGHQHFPEVDIDITDSSGHAAKKYKLSDATIVSLRASGVAGDGTGETVEQLRISYAKIEVLQ
jgi:type VI protein secretion system component Hcp